MTTSASGSHCFRWRLSKRIKVRRISGAGHGKIDVIRKHCAEIAADVQALSHELHSSKLDYLGVVAATRSFCREFSKQQSVNVEFTDENVSNHLPRDISLCLFRVTQEALHNAVKYSGVS